MEWLYQEAGKKQVKAISKADRTLLKHMVEASESSRGS